MNSPNKRRETDFVKLMMKDYKVDTINDDIHIFYVQFHGPTDSLYQGGVWKIRVELPEAYPFESPLISFVNKIYHPNVGEGTGTICLDVLKQTWTPMYDLINVLEMFLPQLLLYPNPSDPLNGEAASLMVLDRPAYEQKVKEYCTRYAKPSDIGLAPEEPSNDDDTSEEEEEDGSGSDDDDEIAGKADP